MHKSIYHQISGFNILLSRTIIQRATDGDHPFFTRKCQIVIVCTVFLDGCFLLFPSSQHTTIRTHWTKKNYKILEPLDPCGSVSTTILYRVDTTYCFSECGEVENWQKYSSPEKSSVSSRKWRSTVFVFVE